ncbi:MAG: RNA polymerase sigma factor [Anaeromyxobacteraceae bacterium]
MLLAARGDRDAFARLVDVTRSLVASIAIAETRDAETARDVAQDAYVQVWKDIQKLRHHESFLPFLRQVTRQRARRIAERRRRDVHGPEADLLLAGVPDPAPDAGARIVRSEQVALVREALAALPEDARETVALYYLEGHSAARVAVLLGLTEQAVHQRLSRARERLRADLMDAFGDDLTTAAPGAEFTAVVMSALPAEAAAAMGVTTAAVTAGGVGKLGGAGAGLVTATLIVVVAGSVVGVGRMGSHGAATDVPAPAANAVAAAPPPPPPASERPPGRDADQERPTATGRASAAPTSAAGGAASPALAVRSPGLAPSSLPPPVPFPPDATVANTPAGFRAAIVDVLGRCAPGVEVQDVDCAEYPCIAWAAVDRTRAPSLDLLRCEAWTDTFGRNLVAHARSAADGTAHFVGLLSLPDGGDDTQAIRKRVRPRMDALGQAYGLLNR